MPMVGNSGTLHTFLKATPRCLPFFLHSKPMACCSLRPRVLLQSSTDCRRAAAGCDGQACPLLGCPSLMAKHAHADADVPCLQQSFRLRSPAISDLPARPATAAACAQGGVREEHVLASQDDASSHNIPGCVGLSVVLDVPVGGGALVQPLAIYPMVAIAARLPPAAMLDGLSVTP